MGGDVLAEPWCILLLKFSKLSLFSFLCRITCNCSGDLGHSVAACYREIKCPIELRQTCSREGIRKEKLNRK